MNWDQIEGNWKQVKGQAQAKWGDMTDDELQRAKGNRQEMAGIVQEKYGKTREEAEREVDDWANNL
ncbi:CsbD family protein [Marinovum sp.]|uniref:CsbD family protein n=1 Tax=Marinovum sp. TaxID=2024839 RepID=UPI002B27A95B|nr:CsbD family protein [Marinovum sp.]